MNNKCKFCGYRFKDRDEQICPECLTAREEDISCGVFGDDVHSHAKYDDLGFGADNSFFSKNDTFRDGTNEFLEDERRDENRTSAARYERNSERYLRRADARRVKIPEDPIYRQQSYDPGLSSKNAAGFNRQSGGLQSQNAGQGANGTGPAKKSSGCGCLFFFAVIVFILVFIIGAADGLVSDITDGSRDTKTSTSPVQTSGTVTKAQDSSETEKAPKDFADDSNAVQYGMNNKFRIKQEHYSGMYFDPLELSEEQCRWFMVYIDDDYSPYSNDLGFGGYVINSSYSLYLSDELKEKIEEEDGFDVEITNVECAGYSGYGLISIDMSPVNSGGYYDNGDDAYISLECSNFCLEYVDSIIMEVTVKVGEDYEQLNFALDAYGK